MQILGGIFVGGAGSRFGGAAKGLLPAPDGNGRLIDRLCELLREAGVEPIFVGQRPEYESLGIRMLPDQAALGPLGGLLSLYALGRRVIVLACDMPFVTTLAPLLESEAALAAPKRDGRWEPFYSVHDPDSVKIIAERHAAAGKLSLQALFDAVPATELIVDPCELDDWDTPEDQSRSAGRTIPIRTMSK